ncbi:hypothetical protein LTR84_004691 [Exophiala bonariae]|uniref:RING-type domain-containing protein n=1 Tax=Exophiala bonariae TaxID=1690606 RepID=A0AAV9NNB1_9EURO|nr:hypothetical protein LTR84_004691 [Exophiala bonariae]
MAHNPFSSTTNSKTDDNLQPTKSSQISHIHTEETLESGQSTMAHTPQSSENGLNDDVHPDINPNDKLSILHLVTLCLNGWRIQKGRGPRHNEFCLYCRADVTDSTQMLVHAGNKCGNAWPVSCFLTLIKWEWANRVRRPRSPMRCPMCRHAIYTVPMIPPTWSQSSCGFADDPNVLVKISLFSPDFVVKCAAATMEKARPISFIKQADLKQVPMFPEEKRLFTLCSSITVMGNPGDGAGETIDVNLNPVLPSFVSGLSSEQPDNHPSSPVFDTWVLIDFGHNIFRACTFLPSQMEELQRSLIKAGLHYEEVNESYFSSASTGLAQGGLAAALDGITAGELDRDMTEAQEAAKVYFCESEIVKSLESEPWRQHANFHFLKLMFAAGRASSDGVVENPLYKAFLQSVALAEERDRAARLTAVQKKQSQLVQNQPGADGKSSSAFGGLPPPLGGPHWSAAHQAAYAQYFQQGHLQDEEEENGWGDEEDQEDEEGEEGDDHDNSSDNSEANQLATHNATSSKIVPETVLKSPATVLDGLDGIDNKKNTDLTMTGTSASENKGE